jgi:hypothetical protein
VEKHHQQKDCKRQQQLAEWACQGQNTTLGDCIQSFLEVVAPSPTNQGTQEESQSLPSSGSNTTSSSSNNGSLGSNEAMTMAGPSLRSPCGSHESELNPDSNSGPMDRNQNKAPNESKQDFGEAGQN